MQRSQHSYNKAQKVQQRQGGGLPAASPENASAETVSQIIISTENINVMQAVEGGQGRPLGQVALGQARGPKKDDPQLLPSHGAHKAASPGSATESGPDQKTHDRSMHFASHTSPQDNNHQVKV